MNTSTIFAHFHNSDHCGCLVDTEITFVEKTVAFNQLQSFSTQVKESTIISYKHGIYELCHKLPNNLRHRTLGN